ncbi:response regulator transcription factor [Gracilibacillus suaedae]|uniref:response regulator transcription factor n=1 Tax=Gracilibacillus suaedae TaxID=2820273 RepID=UPI001ABDF4B4|nr:response regulator transcription factor [Gracilibacillus suaedae]
MNKIRVMIADDQKIVCDGLTVMLNQHHELEVVAKAYTGEEAIEKAMEYQPDVILMDIKMPDISGITATKILKEKNPKVKILMLTTFSNHDYILRALKNGASGYLLKDTDVDHLIEVIYQSIKGQILIPESIQPKLIEQLKNGNDEVKSSFESVVDALKERNIHITRTEQHVIKGLLEGYSNQQIADSLHLSIGTVKNYVSKVYRKLGASGRTEAILLLKNL